MVIVIVWIAFIRLEQKANLNLIKSYVKIKAFMILWCLLIIFQFNQHQKCYKIPSNIYAYLEYLIKKIDGRKYNYEKLSTTKIVFLADIPCLQYGQLIVQKINIMYVKLILHEKVLLIVKRAHKEDD